MLTKLVVALTATLVVAVLAVPTGRAQEAGDTVSVTDEPPGANCEFGGVRITVTHVEPEPTEEPTETPEPTPDPTETPTEEPSSTPVARVAQAPEITFVCNGQSGEPGPAGQDGTDGTDGQDGADGDDGADGADGMDADPDTPGVQATPSDRCATAGTVRVKVPKRFRNGARVRVTANGRRRTVRVRKRKVAANLRTVPCGYWPVLIQKRGTRSAVVVLRLTSKRVVRASL